MDARSEADLKVRLSDRRRRSERRTEGDALGQSLSDAFAGERRAGGKRRG
jgi:hypothetical protein